MQHDTLIADVFLRPAQTYSVVTKPGRKLKFLYGAAQIVNDEDLDYVLNLPNASVRPTPRYTEHVALRIRDRDELHPAKAEIDVEGRILTCEQFVAALTELERLRAEPAYYAEAIPPTEPVLAQSQSPIEPFDPPAVAVWTDDDWQEPKRGRTRRE